MFNLGDKVKFYRKEKNLSQSDLSCDCLNRVVLSRIENNKVDPTLMQLIHICKVLNIPITKLISNNEIHPINFCEDSTDELSVLYKEERYYEIIKYLDIDLGQLESKQYQYSFLKSYYFGMSYFNLSIYPESISHLKKFNSSYLKQNESMQLSNCEFFLESLNTLFKAQSIQHKFGDITLLIKAQEYILKFKLQPLEVSLKVLNNLCLCFIRINDYQSLLDSSKSFREEKIKRCFPRVSANIHIGLSICYLNLNNIELAIDNAEKAYHLFSYINFPKGEVSSLSNKISALHHSKQYDEALSIIKSNIITYNYDTSLYGVFQIKELYVYFNQKLFNIIRTYPHINKRSVDIYFIHSLSFIHGHIDYLNGNYQVALKKLNYCIKSFEARGVNLDLYVLYTDLHEITKDKSYITKREKLDMLKFRKNVIVDLNDFVGEDII